MQPVTSTTTVTTTPVPFRKSHPIRGIAWGFMMGLGAAVIAILLKIIPFDLVWALIVLAGGILIGILWSTLGPAKKPKGVPPRPTEVVTHRPDWDASAVPPSAPTSPVPPVAPPAPGVEPLHIQPLDVEPLDIPSPADVPVETLPDPAEPAGEPFPGPPRTMDPPERSDPPPPPPPPPG
jgi:hypothetical protein